MPFQVLEEQFQADPNGDPVTALVVLKTVDNELVAHTLASAGARRSVLKVCDHGYDASAPCPECKKA